MSTLPNPQYHDPQNPHAQNNNAGESFGESGHSVQGSDSHGSYRLPDHQQQWQGQQPGQFTQQPGNGGFGNQHQYGQTGYGQHPGYSNQPGYGQQFGQPTGGFGGQQQTFDAYGNPIPSDAKMIAVLSHLSSLVATVLSATFLSFVAPLIFWFIYKDKPGYAFVRVASAGAFNFNFTMWVINMAAWLVILITFGIAAIFMWIVFLATTIAMLVFHIIAAVKANNGEVYNYPMQIRILK